jgi:hypothetical protein
MLDPRQYWDGHLSHFDVGPSSASGHHHNHVRSHNDVGLLGSVEPSSVSHPESIQHVVNLPPPFHYSSSSLSSALSSPHTLSNRYAKSTAASSGCYQTGEPCAAPVPIASAPPAANTPAVFDYRAQALVSASQATGHTQDRPHLAYENHVAQRQCDDAHHCAASTPAHPPVLSQHASGYYPPAPHHNERTVQPVHHQLMGDGDHSPSSLSRDLCYPHLTTQSPSLSLVPSGLGPIHDATNSYYEQLGHDLRHFVIPSSPTVSNVHHEYYSSSSPSDLCSSVSPVDTASCHNQYYPSEHAVPAHQDRSSFSRPTTATAEGCGDYYQPQPKGQSQPQLHSLPNESEIKAHRAPMPVVETSPPPVVPHKFYPATSAQPSASVIPSAYAHPRAACVLPKAIGSVAKRGPPVDTSSLNPDDPNPRPAARPRPSVMRKRPDLHAPLRLSSDLPATNE